jgi:hypothetical protein
VQASWRKYPNPMNTAVIGTDVVERKILDGVLHTHRLVSSKWYFPRWAQAVSDNFFYCIRNYLIQSQFVLCKIILLLGYYFIEISYCLFLNTFELLLQYDSVDY